MAGWPSDAKPARMQVQWTQADCNRPSRAAWILPDGRMWIIPTPLRLVEGGRVSLGVFYNSPLIPRL
jgi:hypothetical protein